MSLSTEPAAGAAPVLLIGIGNPSRGDDAIGPLAIERLEKLGLPETELLTDFQLQVEHALDLVGRREIVFIDAAASGTEPFSFGPVAPAVDASATTHALSPAAVLDAFLRVSEATLPVAYVLAVRGYDFELGTPLSDTAAENLEAALQMLISRLIAGPDQVRKTHI
ncbi:MAG: hydrogenase maturation protease [Pseudomonadota bacterium]|nr:hydrogenase maturation protease [Pseudomonadota bacterium]